MKENNFSKSVKTVLTFAELSAINSSSKVVSSVMPSVSEGRYGFIRGSGSSILLSIVKSLFSIVPVQVSYSSSSNAFGVTFSLESTVTVSLSSINGNADWTGKSSVPIISTFAQGENASTVKAFTWFWTAFSGLVFSA